MKNLTETISSLITAAVVLTVGVLCIVANAASGSTAANAYESISIVLGSVFIAISALALIAEVLVNKTLATGSGVSAGVLLATGIFFVCDKYVAGNLLGVLVEYVPYLLLVMGSIIIVDAVFVLVYSKVKKSEYKYSALVSGLVVGGLALLFGILAMTVDGIKNNKFMILGIILIIFAVLTIASSVVEIILAGKKKNNEANNDVIDAEVTEATPASEAEVKEEISETEVKEETEAE